MAFIFIYLGIIVFVMFCVSIADKEYQAKAKDEPNFNNYRRPHDFSMISRTQITKKSDPLEILKYKLQDDIYRNRMMMLGLWYFGFHGAWTHHPNTVNPHMLADHIVTHMPWVIDTLDYSAVDNNALSAGVELNNSIVPMGASHHQFAAANNNMDAAFNMINSDTRFDNVDPNMHSCMHHHMMDCAINPIPSPHDIHHMGQMDHMMDMVDSHHHHHDEMAAPNYYDNNYGDMGSHHSHFDNGLNFDQGININDVAQPHPVHVTPDMPFFPNQ